MKKLFYIASSFSLGLVMVMMFSVATPVTAEAQFVTKAKRYGSYRCPSGLIIQRCFSTSGGCLNTETCPG